MATVTLDAAAPGKGAVRPVQVQGAAVLKIVTGKFSFDASYPTGGEDISEITGLFREFLGIVMESPIGSTGTGLHVVIDRTTKKAKLFTNAADPAEVADTSDQSNAANLAFFAWGIA